MTRNKEITLSILNGASLKEVADTYGITSARVVQIFRKELRLLHPLVQKIATPEEWEALRIVNSLSPFSLAKCLKYADELKSILAKRDSSETK